MGPARERLKPGMEALELSTELQSQASAAPGRPSAALTQGSRAREASGQGQHIADTLNQ